MGDNVRIERLTGANYYTWRPQMEGLLTIKGVHRAITDPDDLGEQELADGIIAKAKAFILLNVSKEYQHLVTEAATAIEAWHSLEATFSTICQARILQLTTELYGMRMSPKETVQDYYSRAVGIKQQLASAGRTVPDLDFKGAILQGLQGNARFKDLDEQLNQWATAADVTPATLYAHLLGVEQRALNRRPGNAPGAAAANALVADSGSGARKPNGGARHQGGKGGKAAGTIRCAYCKAMTDHNIANCPRKRAADAKHGNKPYCTRCKAYGHSLEQCYARREEAAKRIGAGGAYYAEACVVDVYAATDARGDGCKTPLACAAPARGGAPTPNSTAKYTSGKYDPEDFMLHTPLFNTLDTKHGPFELEAAADIFNAHMPSNHCDKHVRNFFSEDIAGMRIFANPPFKSAAAFIKHYLRAKLRDPSSSAVFILPYKPEASWWPLVASWHVSALYPAGTHAFTMGPVTPGGPRREGQPLPFDVVALWDPPHSNAADALLLAGAQPDIIIDSGASEHIFADSSGFISYRKPGILDMPWVRDASGTLHKVLGVGQVMLRSTVEGAQVHYLMLRNVLHVPSFSYNLISTGAIATRNRGAVTTFGDTWCQIKFGKEGVAKLLGERADGKGLYRLTDCVIVNPVDDPYCPQPNSVAALAADRAANTRAGAELWHRRLGHIAYSSMAKLPGICDGITLDAAELKAKQAGGAVCEDCMHGRQARDARAPATKPKAATLLERIHVDLCGPMTETLGGNKYFLIVVDEASRYSKLVLLKAKSDAPAALIDVIRQWERATESRVKAVRSDQGREFINNELASFYQQHGIKAEATAAYSPESNGMAERCNRTIMERVRSMMADAGVPDCFWGEAASYANQLRNVSPAAGLTTTPYEAFYGRKPDISKLRIFGALAYVHVPKETRTKLQSKTAMGVLLRVDPDSCMYRVYIHGDIKWFRDAIIDETKESAYRLLYRDNDIDIEPSNDQGGDNIDHHLDNFESGDEGDGDGGQGDDSSPETSAASHPTRSPYLLRSRATAAVNVADSIAIPTSVEDALNGPQRIEWKAAMDKEMEALLANGTYELCDRPANVMVLPSKWVFTLKRKPDGSIERFKARLVAGGHRQKEGIDYAEVFAPVGRYDTFRMLMAKAAHDNLELGSLDISNAFLHGELSIPVYMHQPKGYFNGDGTKVWKLKKTLYGLKQAPKEWYNVLSNSLQESGLIVSDNDRSLWMSKSSPKVYLLHWVDDLIMASASKPKLEDTKAGILSKFKGRDLGDANTYLNIKIARNRTAGTLTLSTPSHITKLLHKFNLSECKTRDIPLATGADLSAATASEPPLEAKARYLEAVGALMYISNVARPDIALATNCLAKHMCNPTERHYQLLKQVLRYLAGTKDDGITYGTAATPLIGYTDSDWAACKDTRRSRGGYVFLVYGGAVAWQSKQHTTVSTSTAEAEYISAAAAARQGIYLKRIGIDLDINTKEPVELNIDNRAAIHMATNAADTARTKHIDVCHHFLRARVNVGDIRTVYVSTNDNPADMFTKPLAGVKFNKFKHAIGMA